MLGRGERTNLAARLLEGAHKNGWDDRVAVLEGEKAWTFGVFSDQSRRIAQALRRLNVRKGERVAVLMPDSFDAATALIGIMYAGAVAVPLSELATPLDVRDYLNDSEVVTVIVHSRLEPVIDEIRSEVNSLREVISTPPCAPGEHDFHKLIRDTEPASSPVAVRADQPAMILYAGSGDQEGPRGVPHVHATPH